jgi:hypothetical protein
MTAIFGSFPMSQSHRTHLVNSHGDGSLSCEQECGTSAVAIPPYSSGQFPLNRLERLERRHFRPSQSHRTHLVNSPFRSMEEAVEYAKVSHTHRTHLANSHSAGSSCTLAVGTVASQSHRTHLVNSHTDGSRCGLVCRTLMSSQSHRNHSSQFPHRQRSRTTWPLRTATKSQSQCTIWSNSTGDNNNCFGCNSNDICRSPRSSSGQFSRLSPANLARSG